MAEVPATVPGLARVPRRPTGRPRRRGHARLTSDPDRPRGRADGAAVPGRLRRGGGGSAGAGRLRRRATRSWSAHWPTGAWRASPWPGSPAGPPSASTTVVVHPGVYVPRWQSLELARRAGARLPDDGAAIDLCTGTGAVAAAMRAARPASPDRGDGQRRARGRPAPGPTGSRPRRAICSRPCRRRSAADRRRRRRGALRPLPRAAPAPPRHPRRSRTPRTTTAARTAPTCCAGSYRGRTGFLRRGGALLLELGGDQAELLRPALERRGLRLGRDLVRRGRRPARPAGRRFGLSGRAASATGEDEGHRRSGPPRASAGRGPR